MNLCKLVFTTMVAFTFLAGPAWGQGKMGEASLDEVNSLLAYMVGDEIFTGMAQKYNLRVAADDGNSGERPIIGKLECAVMVNVTFEQYHEGDKDAGSRLEDFASAFPIDAPMNIKMALLETMTKEFLRQYPKQESWRKAQP